MDFAWTEVRDSRNRKRVSLARLPEIVEKPPLTFSFRMLV